MSLSTIRMSEAPAATAVTYHRFARVDDSGFDEGPAIRGQREAARRRAAELGATVLEEFIDPGVSGRTPNRPALQRMLAYIETHDVTYCIVGSIASLARDPFTYARIHEALTHAGVSLMSCEDGTGTSQYSGFIHELLSAMAEFEAERLPSNVADDASAQATHSLSLIGSRSQSVDAPRAIR